MTYVVTASGQRFDLINPDPAMVDWDDVAARLHRIPRYAGTAVGEHVGSPVYEYGQRWTVAQHTLLVCALAADVSPKATLYAALHDAHEGYIGDWITPLKRALPQTAQDELQWFETRIAAAIHQRAGVPPIKTYPHLYGIVTDADQLAYAMEVRHLIAWQHAIEFYSPDIDLGPVEAGRGVIEAIASTPNIPALLADTIRKAITEAS